MRALLQKLYRDDCGAVIAVEFVLVMGIVVIGLIPGFVALTYAYLSYIAAKSNAGQGPLPPPAAPGDEYVVTFLDPTPIDTNFTTVDPIP